jgi:hypothetical protein
VGVHQGYLPSLGVVDKQYPYRCRQKVDDWVEKVRIQLRANARDYVALFNEAINHPKSDFLPKSSGRSIIEIGEWRSDKEQYLASQQVASGVAEVKQIRMYLYSRAGF